MDHEGMEALAGGVRERLVAEADAAGADADRQIRALVDAEAALLAVPPVAVFHVVDVGADDHVSSIHPVTDMGVRENGGYFVLRPSVIDRIPPGGDLVGDACTAMAKEGKLLGYPYDGFWLPADTLKERNELEASYRAGTRPWMVWEKEPDRDPIESLVSRELSGQEPTR